MKYVRRGMYVFAPLVASLFAVQSYISTNNFKGVLTNILKSSGLNVTFDSVELKGLNKIEIKNLVLLDQDNKLFIDAKRTTATVNLLMPSRLSKIDVYDAKVVVDRHENNEFNVYKILKPSDDSKVKTVDRASRIGRLYIHNATVDYSYR